MAACETLMLLYQKVLQSTATAIDYRTVYMHIMGTAVSELTPSQSLRLKSPLYRQVPIPGICKGCIRFWEWMSHI
jgi:hypothetical protein